MLVVAEHSRWRTLHTLGDADVGGGALVAGHGVAELLANVPGSVFEAGQAAWLLWTAKAPSLGPGCFTRAMRSDVVNLGLVDCLGWISIGASRRQGVPAINLHELGYVR